MNDSVAQYSVTEEIINSITHGIGILLSIAGLTVLVAYSTLNGNVWHIVTSSIFGVTLILMYSASTLYHGVFHVRTKSVLQRLDHAAIYLLIAGTYTPFLLVNLRDGWGWALFTVIWSMALLGVVFELTGYKPFKRVSLSLYMVMGWMIIVAIEPMLESVATGGLLLLVAGGLAYTVGVIFYVKDTMPFNHAIWHVFVMAGSVFHYFAILLYVIP